MLFSPDTKWVSGERRKRTRWLEKKVSNWLRKQEEMHEKWCGVEIFKEKKLRIWRVLYDGCLSKHFLWH
jgi:hypothetical protein